MAITFLDLPGEIRNEIYRWILPTPSNPSLVYLRGEPEDGSPIGRKKSLTPGLYRTCKIIHEEIPSLLSLLLEGAIVPTVLIYGVQLYRHRESRKFLYRLLPPATRLRIVDEEFVLGKPPKHPLCMSGWQFSRQATEVLGIFLMGLPPPSSEHYSRRAYFNIDRSYFQSDCQHNLRLKKFLDIPVDPRSRGSLPSFDQVVSLLEDVERYDVFWHLTAVRLESIRESEEPEAVARLQSLQKKVNEEVELNQGRSWLREPFNFGLRLRARVEGRGFV